jgi:hypothetical protein
VGWLALSVELAVTVGWARVPVVQGHAELWDVAAHLRLGLVIDPGAVTLDAGRRSRPQASW